jgi:acetylglutamate kinase
MPADLSLFFIILIFSIAIMNYSHKIKSLAESLPSMPQIQDLSIVIKYGGAAMTDPTLTDRVIKDIILLSSLGATIVLVHGGGPEINHWLSKMDIEPIFHKGIRTTDTRTMEIVEMVLSGKINKNLVSLINANNGRAVGLSGKDGSIILAKPIDRSHDNLVGCVKIINTELITILSNKNYIPIISPIASDELGQSYNINADIVAGEIASALKVERLIILTDTSGILADVKDPTTVIRSINTSGISDLINNGTISGGMLPKINCCLQALSRGVYSTHIIDGRIPHCLLASIFNDQPVGTTIIK